MLSFLEILQGSNPFMKISTKSLSKLEEFFDEDGKNFLLANYYYYFMCNPTDFVIEINNVWKWIGYTRSSVAKRDLIKNFKEDIDYEVVKEINHKEQIFMTPKCFRKLCLRAGTDRSDWMYDYYMKLEVINLSVLAEELLEIKHEACKSKKITEKLVTNAPSKDKMFKIELIYDRLFCYGCAREFKEPEKKPNSEEVYRTCKDCRDEYEDNDED